MVLGRPGSYSGTFAGIFLILFLFFVSKGAGYLIAKEAVSAAPKPKPAAAALKNKPAAAALKNSAAPDETAPPADVAEPPVEGAASQPAVEAPPADETASMPPDEGAPEKLLSEASGMVQAGKFDEAVELLRGKDEAFASSPELLECYLEASINKTKPNLIEIEGKAGALLAARPKSSIGNYCMGRVLSEKKKPNLEKALEYLGKAKSAKTPPKGAAMDYWKVWTKKNWPMLAGAVGAILAIIFKVVQKRKAAKAAGAATASGAPDISAALGASAASGTSEGSGGSGASGTSADLQAIADAATDLSAGTATAATTGAATGTVTGSTSRGPAHATAADTATATDTAADTATDTDTATGKGTGAGTGTATDEATPPGKSAGAPSGKGSTPQKTAEAKKAVAKRVEVATAKVSEPPAAHKLSSRPTAVAGTGSAKTAKPQSKTTIMPATVKTEDSPPTGAETSKAGLSASIADRKTPAGIELSPIEEMDLATAARVRNSLESTARPVIPPNASVEDVWAELCRKALSRPVALDFQVPTEGLDSTGDSGSSAVGGNSDLTFLSDSVDVSADLSENALKPDLLGKLKMLAISDGELRKLLHQRNPDHIPNLVEYILTKPDPVRLAFVGREMGNYHDPAVTDVLASFLYNDDHRVVLGAVHGLQTNGGNTAILHLCPFVQSEIPAIAEAARNALSSFGAKRILEAFYNLSADPDEGLRAAGVYVLARMRGEQVSRILGDLLYDQSLNVRREVMLAMAFQKEPAYLVKLREFARKAASEDDKRMARKTIVYLQGFVSATARAGQGLRAT